MRNKGGKRVNLGKCEMSSSEAISSGVLHQNLTEWRRNCLF